MAFVPAQYTNGTITTWVDSAEEAALRRAAGFVPLTDYVPTTKPSSGSGVSVVDHGTYATLTVG